MWKVLSYINGNFCKENVNSTKNHVVLKEKSIQEMFYYNDIYSLLLTIPNPNGKTQKGKLWLVASILCSKYWFANLRYISKGESKL